ncbi:MAG TPA: transcription termination/antitermination protein NusA [Candidatus Onthoplasma faecigallinarum]|nr:transcription termination/antitermination protein NusA [Candidatus Onthoplasma faecigallinarum]
MINKDFFEALKDLEAEKGIKQDVFIAALEQALTAAYKKNSGMAKNAQVRLLPEKNTIKIYSYRTVVDNVEDEEKEISLEDAKQIKHSYKIGDLVMQEESTKDFNRIAVQTAKQVITQKIKEIEKQSIYKDIAEKEGKLIVANVKRIDVDNVYLEIGGTTLEGLLTKKDMLPNDNFKPGDKVKVYVRHIKDDFKGTVVQVTRTHPNFVRLLLEMEVPELNNGEVTIVGLVREAGLRTKIAVSTTVPNLDPVGACIGNKGSRINAVINELNGEKIDIINYSENPADYIVAALSPAEVSEITVDTAAGIANVLVPENKLSLAIGKGGHNVRLAAKLTGYKIDVKPTTQTVVNTKSNDVVSTGNANIIIDDDFFSDIDE